MKNHIFVEYSPKMSPIVAVPIGSQDPKSNPKPAQHDPVLEHALQRQVANLRCVWGGNHGEYEKIAGKTMANNGYLNGTLLKHHKSVAMHG